MSTSSYIKIDLPNGMQVYCAPDAKVECKYLYTEVFDDQLYTRNGVHIKDGDCIIDVGANIGLFSLYATQQAKNLKIYSFEPVPPIYEAFELNLEETIRNNGQQIQLMKYGVSNKSFEDEMTYYPQSPANSTLYHDDKSKEFEAVIDGGYMRDLWKYDKLGYILLMFCYPFRRRLLLRTFKKIPQNNITFKAQFKTLSQVIEEQKIERINLLKIDIEGSEFDALEGISDAHWDKIDQLVVEISSFHLDRIDTLKKDLTAKGFKNLTLETMGQHDFDKEKVLPCNLYATR